MSRIFLSHVEKDLSIMQQIVQGLEAIGYATFLSYHHIEL